MPVTIFYAKCYTFQISTEMQPLLKRWKYIVSPSQKSTMFSSRSATLLSIKIKISRYFRDAGLNQSPEWNTRGRHWLNNLLFWGERGVIQSETLPTQDKKKSQVHNSYSLKQQLHFSWKCHIQHLPLMNSLYILVLTTSQDKRLRCLLCIFRMYSFTPGERSLT